MRKLALAAILLSGFGLAAPASAAVYCFDGAGRSLGGGFDRETPDYRQIDLARRTGGYCRDVGHGRSIPHLEQQNYYHDGGYYYRGDGYRRPRYRHYEGYEQRKDYRYPSTDPRYHKAPDYSKPQPPVSIQPNEAR